jgi:hypothetical protein
VTLYLEIYGVMVTKIAVARDFQKTLPAKEIPGNMPAPPPSLLVVNRTDPTSTQREVRTNKLNIIPHVLPHCLIVNGVQKYVSMSHTDPNYRIHTVSLFESEN